MCENLEEENEKRPLLGRGRFSYFQNYFSSRALTQLRQIFLPR